MCTPVVFDACCIKQFQDERIQDEPGHATIAIEHIFSNGWLVLDNDDHCIQEWRNCASGAHQLSLDDWVNNEIINGNIKIVEVRKNQQVKEKLRTLGLPKSDEKWVHLAQSALACAIVTEDIDLFDPKHKKSNSKTINRIKKSRTGCVCKYVEKSLSIKVMTLSSVPDLISPCLA